MSKHLIHHITHVTNLPGILAEGGIWCDRESFDKALCRQSIGYADIKGRRSKRHVERLFGERIAAGGMVSDYVPFYFCNRSPMLGAISQGKVPLIQWRSGGGRVSRFQRREDCHDRFGLVFH